MLDGGTERVGDNLPHPRIEARVVVVASLSSHQTVHHYLLVHKIEVCHMKLFISLPNLSCSNMEHYVQRNALCEKSRR